MRKGTRLPTLCAGLAIGLLAASLAPAQGILILHQPGERIAVVEPTEVIIVPPPRPPRPPRPPQPPHIQPAQLTSLEVDVDIEGLVATTSLDQTFCNPNNRRLEGTYFFPLPRDAVIKDMSLYIDGKPVKCEVVEAAKARKIYEDIVRRSMDPALLEYVGRDLIKLRIFPIEPKQTRRVKFQYGQVLKRDFGLTEYSYPLVGRKQAEQKIGSFTLSGTIRADKAIANVYSPTHDIDFNHKDDKTIKFSYEKEDHRAKQNLKIYYSVAEKDLGAGLVTYRKGDDDGYFMLMIAPRAEIDKKKAIPKDVTFVFDTSGSMNGEKIEQARNALLYCLNSLRDDDRFNIIRFSTEAEAFAEDLVKVSKKKIKEAREFVEGFEARGGTAINDALAKALSQKRDKDRPHLIVFLTDGKPTLGERDPDTILGNVKDANEGKARVFVFGVGNGVNTHLLDRLADGAGGVSDYVTPKEDIEVKVSNFFSKVSDPILTDLKLECGDIKISKFYPKELPDLFAGTQITLIGRYKGSGKTDVVLTGSVAGKKQAFEHEVEFADESKSADFLPRLWAIRRVGHLVDEIRKSGEDKELKDEIVRLGKKYAIATPYTSMLVLEDGAPVVATGPRPFPGGRRGNARLMQRMPAPAGVREEVEPVPFDALFSVEPERRIRGSSDAWSQNGAGREGTLAPPRASAVLHEESGADAVKIARDTRSYKESKRFDDKDSPWEIRTVASRTFYLIDGVWTDSDYKDGTATTDVKYGSKEYFDLLNKGGDVGSILALGPKVVFQLDGKWYRITAD